MKTFKKKRIIKKDFKINKNFNENILVRIFNTFNNTIINITDYFGKTIYWTSAGISGLKGKKKSSPYSSQLAGEVIGKNLLKWGFKTVNILIKGLGPGRDSSIKGIFNSGIKILSISDVTPLPHNGCRLRKPKRN